jgi:hypothetical protein
MKQNLLFLTFFLSLNFKLFADLKLEMLFEVVFVLVLVVESLKAFML